MEEWDGTIFIVRVLGDNIRRQAPILCHTFKQAEGTKLIVWSASPNGTEVTIEQYERVATCV